MDFLDTSIDWSQIPSAIPPPGQAPNFVNPENNSHIAKVVISVLLPLSLVFVVLRSYCNFALDRKRAYSDYACILATMTLVSYIGVMYFAISQGTIGRHMWDVPVIMNTNSSVQSFMILSILYGPGIFLAKLTVLFLYLELFKIHRPTKIMVYVAIAICTAHLLATIIGNAVLCVPLPGKSWALKTATHNCIAVADELSIATGAISVLNDLLIIVIPIPVIWRLKLPTRQKVAVSVIFITGIFALLASILAVVYRVRQYQTKDNTWNSSYTYMLCAVEMSITIMCSCMPSFSPYIRTPLQVLSRKWSSFSSRVGKYFSGRSNSTRQYRGSVPLEDLEKAERKARLTLGSAFHKQKVSSLQKGETGVSVLPLEDAQNLETVTEKEEGTRDGHATLASEKDSKDTRSQETLGNN